ncbi:O-methyltransferase [Aspergillus luchuensis]|uniref:O-methyltransferase n=2 Tax=Aspergillus kawachii TaxID=1069201 RepID=A0A146FST7_ASPKA|nr:O-methyltransferase [Aspergillus luchuensis]
MRVLLCNGFAKKRGLNHYAPTAWSTQMTERTTIDMADSMLDDLPRLLLSLSSDILLGARAYYLKNIMHDWSDENRRRILSHITSAMEKGYSKLLLEDHIVPDQNAGARETLLDMTVVVWCPGIERTRRQWTELLQSVGLVIRNFWLPEGHAKGVIEAELLDARGI